MKKLNPHFYLAFPVLFTFLLVFQGCKEDSDEDDAPAGNDPPSCVITSPVSGIEIDKGETVSVAVTASDADGSISQVKLFLDGSERGTVTAPPYDFSWNTTNESAGNHILSAVAYDDQMDYASDEINVIIKDTAANDPPLAGFSADPTSGEPPLTVTFTDESTNAPILWDWQFGDGASSTEQNPTYVYDEEGVYTVSLKVTNEYGQDTETKTDYITVSVGGGTVGSFTDPRDGQQYATIEINGQVWLSENLRYEIGNSWAYNDSNQYVATYGRLYTWNAADSACPSGWHLPTDSEWKQLEIYLGMSPAIADQTGYRGTFEGRKMKSTDGWLNNGNGTNISGFDALPGGIRYNAFSWGPHLEEGHWWSATDAASPDAAWVRKLKYNDDRVGRYSNQKTYGLSIRCVED
jgi:uncharacterized protein (TIGR02145 family)